MKLKTLSIRCFRGATKPVRIDFDPSKNITMVFGENGNGKTTIADALVCLCTDDRGSIEDKASVDESYLCSVGSSPSDVSIELETDAGRFRAELNVRPKGTFSKSPDEGLPGLRFLRRKQIIAILEEQPAQRYETLQEYIDVSGVMASEDGLRKLIKTTKSDLTSELKSLTDSTGTLERIWQEEGRPLASWEEWAKAESAKDLTKETETQKKLAETISRWEAIYVKFDAIKSQKAGVKQSKEILSGLLSKLSELEGSGKTGSARLLSVLESAQDFIIHHENLEYCPVCKNSVVKESLMASLDAEIKSMKMLQSLTREIETARHRSERSETVLQNTIREFNEIVGTFSENTLEFAGKESRAAIEDLREKSREGQAFESWEEHLTDLTEFINKVKTKAARILNTIKQFNAIRENYRTITRVKDNAQSLQNLLHVSEVALKRVEYIRKKFIEDSLNAVSADIEAMYSQLHPGEGLGGIRLFLHPTRKNSIEISSSFHSEKDVTPQSLYSESHLDTLGICIFLALAKKYNDGNTILLLDDVMMSVDDAHLDRFIQLLHDISDDFTHLLLTTHYRPWRDRYRNNRADASKVHFLELRPWSKERGITFQNGKIDVEELRRLLADTHFGRQKLASTSGIVLENILDFITYKFGSKLPRKPRNDYTLRELVDCLSKNLVPVMRVEHMEREETGKFSKTQVKKQQELKSLIEKIKALSIVRNLVGAHFNLEGSSINDKDVREFAETTLELADLLICPELGSLPDRKPSGSYWETKSGSIRLYPLQEPA